LDLELNPSAKVRRPFDAIHFLLTPCGAQPPRTGTLLPPTAAEAADARKSKAGA